MSKNNKQLIINYVPGEECRIAVMQDNRLEEFHAERMDNASHVGNIYVGRVSNVEPGIQAAFVDFGLESNGFLHVTDLHPQYFPGEDEETTERVGKKTPRRERPPIQSCLRKGQEIAVQVIKEGVGTKGPTLTSYLSIPGRFLVMMPQMDKVGVSRKVEDEEQRRKMREILDQLDLPDGFGFILRTAGMDQTRTELKRDLAYLQRLWKDMEKRWKTGNKPRLLYSESDLLVRALRDMLTSDVDKVVIDNEGALNRAARFLKIVAPRTAAKLVRYTAKTPIFHALGIESQLQLIHAREVPLPGGGRLVIDQTEALVAIDVNSGKMRDARDAETTAYRTNMEAADEIPRQLRLRDLGGVIVNDFIDMRSIKHRRELEHRFKENLKSDRARTTTAPVSPFGTIEMTRQRMRGSHESVHFTGCPTCRGRGLVQKPDSVASDGLRELQWILDHERVSRVEMVVSPRIAGELLSSKRKSLSRIERELGKRVDVRVSDAIPIDRVSFYAYDERGADVDIAKLSHQAASEDVLVPFVPADSADWTMNDQPEPEPEPEPLENVPEFTHPIEFNFDEETSESTADQPRHQESRQERRDHDDRREPSRRGRRGRRGRGGERGHETNYPPEQSLEQVASHEGVATPSTDSAEAVRVPHTPLRLVDRRVESHRDESGDHAPNQEGSGRRRGRGRGRGRDDRRPIQKTPAAFDESAPSSSQTAPDHFPTSHGEIEQPMIDSGFESRSSEIDRHESSTPPPNHLDSTDEFFDSETASVEPISSDSTGGPDLRTTDDRGDQGHGRSRRRRGRRRGGRDRGRDSRQSGGPAPHHADQPPPPRAAPGHDRNRSQSEGFGDFPVRQDEVSDQPDRAGRRRRRGRRRGRGGDQSDRRDDHRDTAQPRHFEGQRPDTRRFEDRPMNQPNRPRQPQQGRSDRPRPESAPPAPPPRPAPTPQPQPAPKPRTLYGVGRRKLSPGEVRSRPAEE